MAKNLCKSQFKVSNFRVRNVEMENFYTFEWWNCRVAFAIYRSVMLVWSLGWLIHFWANQNQRYHYTQITNWTELYLFLYYSSAFIVAVYGAVTRKRQVPTTAGPIRFFQGMAWVFQSLTFGSTLFVLITFWALIAKNKSDTYIQSARNIYVHGLMFGALLIDFFMAAIPVRLFHAVHVFLGFLVYTIFVIIWYFVKSTPIYSFLDFDNNRSIAIGVAVGLNVLGPIISQTILFFLYWLKTLCSKRDQEDTSQPAISMEGTVIKNISAMEKQEEIPPPYSIQQQ